MINRLHWPSTITSFLIAGVTAGLSLSAAADQNPVDAALVDSLQSEQEIRDGALREGMPGLTPEDIRALRRLVNEQEAARNNPQPPTVTNKVSMLTRGESPTILIMERFDTTVMFTDRHGDPIEITSSRINDEQAAHLVPIHSQEMASVAPEPVPTDPDIVMPADSTAPDTGGQGAVKALIISPESAMRSTNLTVMLKGQSHPIVVTVSTRSSLNLEQELAYIQELRLSWVSNMPRAQALAGRFGGSAGGSSLSDAMLSLVQGVPSPDMVAKELEGPLATQVSLWHDEVEDIWYLRTADHIEPWNVSISDRTRDGLRGFTVTKLNGPPPRLIDMSANGQFSTLILSGD